MAKSAVKNEQLITLVSDLEKRYGKGIMMSLQDGMVIKIPVLPTRLISLDQALGVGGLPWGRIVEIYGLESSGKTTLALELVAQAQKSGHKALFIDAEHAFDRKYAQALGINLEELLICQPDYGEQALDIVDKSIRSQVIKLVIIDSVSALIPETELKGEIGNLNIGGQARLMSQAMRKLASNVYKANAIVVFINQVRHKVGITFGSPEVTSGGHALKFYSTIRIKVSKSTLLKNNEGNPIGHECKIKIVKNKVAAPFKEVHLDLIYGEGLSRQRELIKIALEKKIIQKTGSWFSFEEKTIAQGKEGLCALLKKDSILLKKIEQGLKK